MELTEVTNSELNSILSNFDVNPSKFTYEKINTGYINDSYFVKKIYGHHLEIVKKVFLFLKGGKAKITNLYMKAQLSNKH